MSNLEKRIKKLENDYGFMRLALDLFLENLHGLIESCKNECSETIKNRMDLFAIRIKSSYDLLYKSSPSPLFPPIDEDETIPIPSTEVDPSFVFKKLVCGEGIVDGVGDIVCSEGVSFSGKVKSEFSHGNVYAEKRLERIKAKFEKSWVGVGPFESSTFSTFTNEELKNCEAKFHERYGGRNPSGEVITPDDYAKITTSFLKSLDVNASIPNAQTWNSLEEECDPPLIVEKNEE